MAESTREQPDSLSPPSEECKELERSRVSQGSALLLTTAPIESLRDQLGELSALGEHFYSINTSVLFSLKDDPFSGQIRTALINFNTPMNLVSEALRDAFLEARAFYVHNRDEFIPSQDEPKPITQEMIETLKKEEFRLEVIKSARVVADQVAKAAKTVREKVLPMLPQLKQDLDEYANQYAKRVAEKERRQQSWLWSLFDDPRENSRTMPLGTEVVEALLHHLSAGSELLRLLPAFFDNVELHFRRLSEITSQQISDLGYSSDDDLARLYQDRLLCNNILDQMGYGWVSSLRAFSIGIHA